MSARYMLTIHLISGQRLFVPCETYEIIPRADHHGAPLPPEFQYTPAEGAPAPLVYLNFGTIAAIEAEDRGNDGADGDAV